MKISELYQDIVLNRESNNSGFEYDEEREKDGYEELLTSYNYWKTDLDLNNLEDHHSVVDEAYFMAMEGLSELNYEARDVEMLTRLKSDMDEDIENENFGLFLSAAINQANLERLNLYSMPEVEYLGYKNSEARIKVDGDVGEYLGCEMEGGEIEIKGNVNEANFGGGIARGMKGGHIEIEGDVGRYLAKGMEGGKIEVNGNTGREAGLEMTGGQIDIRGEAGDDMGKKMEGGLIRANKVSKKAGAHMKNGKIIIEENGGADPGHLAEGGTIIINDEIKTLTNGPEGGTLKLKEGLPETGLIGEVEFEGEIYIEKNGEWIEKDSPLVFD